MSQAKTSERAFLLIRNCFGVLVHRLVATLGLLYYFSPNVENLAGLIEALEGQSRVKEKASLLSKDATAAKLVKEMDALLSCRV